MKGDSEMMNKSIKEEYLRWCNNATGDEDLITELKAMTEDQIEDAFYRELAFGTGGLRGMIGAGTNRMNVYIVAKASQGLANYVKKLFNNGTVAVSYDSRIKSELFRRVASAVFAANGLKVWLYDTLMPTPCLSYAVRKLGCSAGIMVTASHNPGKYNGYKVYGPDGCQITTEAAKDILTEIEALDVFSDVQQGDFEKSLADGDIRYIDCTVYDDFVAEVKSQSVLYGDKIDKDVAVVFSPLNGTGLKPVTRTLKESGFTNISIVPEQEMPDGNFPTCPYPNPEIREAMKLGLKMAKEVGADLLLATDPDCDRCGIAIAEGEDYKLLSGNEVGLLLLDYICSQRVKHNAMPSDPVFVKTIVTMDLAEKIAAHYNVRTINVLTGFKYIGEQIGLLEKQNKEASFICGFEESYGYLTGTYVRDKDAVDAAFMICEMFAYYKTRGIGLLQKLEELYMMYGYCMNTLHFYSFEGSAGFNKMQNIMANLRKGLKLIGSKAVVNTLDYSKGLDGLPKSDVLKFILDDDCSMVVRPSGTEPKLKTYISVNADNQVEAKKIEAQIVEELTDYFK